jgi:hypothetical protein
MKKIFFISVVLMVFTFSACAQGAGDTGNPPKEGDVKLKITVGNKVFTAIMYDNATARAFTAKLPMTLNMSEMTGNEKYYNLPENFRADSPSPVGTIRTGELMCWSSNCLVLFYKTFSSGYNYVRLGRIGDASGLADALGGGSVQITFEVNP